MRRNSLIALASILALFLGGCPAGNPDGEAGNETPSPTPVASPPQTTRPSPAPTATPFSNPVTPPREGTAQAVPGLVQTLPPGARAIPQGRSDPFAAIPLQPEVTVSPGTRGNGGTTRARPVPPIPPLPQSPGTNRGTTNNGGTANGGTANRGAGNGGTANRGTTGRQPLARRPNVLPPRSVRRPPIARRPVNRPTARPTSPRNTPIAARATPGRPITPPPGLQLPPPVIPQLPPLPEPDLARQIAVTGVVDVGGEANAIVQVPNEPSRYVKVGQRLSNGQVLVKRIEMNRGPTPVVVLEQYGIEVGKEVGAPAEGTPGQPGSPTASLPLPPPVNNARTSG